MGKQGGMRRKGIKDSTRRIQYHEADDGREMEGEEVEGKKMPQEGEGKLEKMMGEEVCPWGIAFSISSRQGRGGRMARGRGRQPRRERRREQIKSTLL